MIASFENIPEIFINRYQSWLLEWARNMKRWGAVCHFPLSPLPGKPVLVDIPELDEYGNVPLIIVDLQVTRRHGRLVVTPNSHRDADLIRRHCAALVYQ